MSADQWHEMDRIFQEALDLPESERAAFLESACPNEEIRTKVQDLLDQVAVTQSDLLETGVALRGPLGAALERELGSMPAPSGAGAPGDLIDRYRLIQLLGEGGMGEVWEAEQLEPIRRKVALKLVKWGMDTREVLARFDAERQALALMNHRNIARVFDGGATETGRPYFVMERVHGTPITEYCDRNRHGIRERLELFAQVCEGVQHAHQKGIIHRDLKPGNILVAVEGNDAVPKIIDFGVARATHQRLTDHTLATQLGQVLGTPGYMSPEQLEMGGQDIDTRTDVYALGVLLYELLVGVPPFDRDELRAASWEEIRRIVREVTPQRPSLRLREVGGRQRLIAEARRTFPDRLDRALRGDLDWIVGKSLEKDRIRRYASPNEFADDIRRHLNDEPVLAGAPSRTYLVQKFARRHRSALTALTFVFFGLVVAVTVSTSLAIRANRAEREARAQAEVAAREAETTGRVVGFLVGLFEETRPSQQGADITARQLIDTGAERVREDLTMEKAIQARLMSTLGDVYNLLGAYEESEALLKEALVAWEEGNGEEDVRYLEILTNLGKTLEDRGEYDRAHVHLERAVEVARGLPQDTFAHHAMALSNLGVLLSYQGDQEGAAKLTWQSLLEREALGFGATEEAATACLNLATLQQHLGHDDVADSLYGVSIERYRELVPAGNAKLVMPLAGYGGYLIHVERWEAARDCMQEALEICLDVYGERHPEVAYTRHNLGAALHGAGRLDEAGDQYRESCHQWREFLGRHPYVAASLARQGRLASETGDPAAAERFHLEAWDIRREFYGDTDPDTMGSRLLAVVAMRNQERWQTAESILHEMEELTDEVGEPFPQVLEAFAQLYEDQGNQERADEYRRRVPIESATP